MEPKIRVTLIGPNNEVTQDRLVQQSTEFMQGPKIQHDGPMRIEVNLKDRSDVDAFITYLKKLSGKLPIPKESKKKAVAKAESLTKDSYLELLEAIRVKCKTQEDVADMLREYGFRFCGVDYLEERDIQPEFKKKIHQKYQYAVRFIRKAKNPMSDRLDPMLMFGMRLFGKRTSNIHVYLGNKYKETLKLGWKDKDGINFKKPVKIFDFPEFMTLDERNKWRGEHRRILDKPDTKPTKFYDRWKPYVKILDSSHKPK